MKRELALTKRALSTIAIVTLGVLPAHAHHSMAMFDHDAVVTVSGTVVRYDWRNPHVYIFIEAADGSGTNVEWQFEADPTPIMARSGWSRDTLAQGDKVTVRAHPDTTGRPNHALLVSLAKSDGVLLTMRTGGRDAPAAAASIAGVWDGLRGMQARTFNYGRLTEKGARAQAEYDESMNPVIDCVPFPTPTIITAPYLFEVEIRDDRISIRTEFFDVERTIWMDGRAHPANVERTNQGHSIGHWEGDELVVDTIGFADYRAGNRAGIPSGARKHTVERFRLSGDRTRLLVGYVIEDPEFLAEPMWGDAFWDYAPDRKLEPFGCDAENARRFAE